jgi:hypothetical protein
MAYITAEARRELLETVAEAIDEIGAALAALGVAYEQLDERNADRLENELFGPVQRAYGRAKRTHSGFAERHGLEGRTFEIGSAGLASQGVKVLLENAVEAVGEADAILADLQDSMRPVEIGDPELRAGLAEVREIVGGLPGSTREFVRTLGR